MATAACCSPLWPPGSCCRTKLTTIGKQFLSMGLIRCLVVFSSAMVIVLVIVASQLASHRGVVIPLAAVCFISLSLLLYKLVEARRKTKQCVDEEQKVGGWESRERQLGDGGAGEDDPDEEVDDLLRAISGVPARLKLKELEKATCGFRKLLGQGGFGSVYEGELADGTKVAVKRLETEGKLGSKEFCAEVVTISGIHHVNLVRLLGFCVEGSQRLLVYEFMQNGSLDKWLFDKSSSDKEVEKEKMKKKLGGLVETRAAGRADTLSLSWFVRFRIAVETARALAYLHEECRETILHLDVKPQNILLDEEFHAKVSDFGLSRTITREQSRLVTSMRGTPGYLAPEWLVHAGVTMKSDVYSYGMVLLELVSGRRNVDHSRDADAWYFPALAFRRAQERRMQEIVDPSLRDVPGGMASTEMAEAQLAIRVAFWCIQDHVASRPTMSNVVRMLEGNLPVVDPPLSSVFSFSNVLTPWPNLNAIPCFPPKDHRDDAQHIEYDQERPLQLQRPPMLHTEEPFSISIGSSTPNSPLPPPPCR